MGIVHRVRRYLGCVWVTLMKLLLIKKKKGGRDRAQWQMSNSRAAMDACVLRDIPFTG